MSVRRISTADRFWSKVNKDGPVPRHCPELGPCWVWTRSRTGSNGYGQFWVSPAELHMFAHRFAWRLANGSIPAGMLVLHRCDNPVCVREAHLFIGTNADNMRDRNNKGRQSRGKAHGLTCIGPKKGHVYRGETNVGAKVSDAGVLEMRRLHAAGVTQREIARRFDISFQHVNRLVLLKRRAAEKAVAKCG